MLSGSICRFTPLGGDERQYCSPGFNLPVGQAARLLYGTYPEYHTSLDTKETMTIEALCQSVNELEVAFQVLEMDGYYVNRFPFGEIKLDKYGLYPDMNSSNIYSESSIDTRMQLERMLTVLNYADGRHSLLGIARQCRCNIFDLFKIISVLQEKFLLDGPLQ